MNIKKACRLFILTVLFIVPLSAQDAQTGKAEISEKLKMQAVELLRETNRDVSALKLSENRRYFSMEIASLLWDYDEREARAAFEPVMNEVRQSLREIAAEVSKIEFKPERPPANYAGNTNVVVVNSNVMTNSRYAGNSTYYPTNTNLSNGAVSEFYSKVSPELMTKINRALALRRQLVLSLANASPAAAYDFLNETSQIIANSKLKGRYGENDLPLELQVANLSVKKDVDRAAETVRRSALKGREWEISSLITNIYQQNADKGNQLAEEVVQKLKASNRPQENPYGKLLFAHTLLNSSVEANAQIKAGSNKKPLLSESSIRDLAEYIGQTVLTFSPVGYEAETALVYAKGIEKYAPDKASQIRRKFKQMAEKRDANVSEETKKYRENAEKERAKLKLIEAERGALSQKLKGKNLSAQDRALVIEQVKKLISEQKERDAKIMELVYWAMQSDQSGNREITESLINEAESLTAGRETKNYRDYMSNWLLAGGFSSVKPEKSFTLLENTILKLNDVISGFAKMAEFMDDRNEIIRDGEFQMVAGPGSGGVGMGREFFGALPGRNRLIQNLAKADFAKIKALADKFARPEFRITARVMVLRSLLNPSVEGDSWQRRLLPMSAELEEDPF